MPPFRNNSGCTFPQKFIVVRCYWLSYGQLFVTPWTKGSSIHGILQARYWSGLPFPSHSSSKAICQVIFESFAIVLICFTVFFFFFQRQPSQDPTVMNIQRRFLLPNQNGTRTLSSAHLLTKRISTSTGPGGRLCRGTPRSARSAAPRGTPRRRSPCTLRWWGTSSETSGGTMRTRARPSMKK